MFKVKSIGKKAIGLLFIMVMLFILMLNAKGAAAAYEADWPEVEEILSDIQGIYNAPPGNVVTSQGVPTGPLLGNGDIGIAIGGENGYESQYYIGKSDFWTSKPSVGDISKTYPITVGGLHIMMNNGGTSSSVLEQHVQDILNAEVRSKLYRNDVMVNMRSWTADSENLLVVELTTTSAAPVAMKAKLWVPDSVVYPATAGKDSGKMWVSRETEDSPSNSLWVSRVGMSAKILGATATYSTNSDNESVMDFSISSSSPVRIITSINGGKNATSHLTDAKNDVAALTDTLVDDLYTEHLDWWKKYWLKSYVQLDNDILQKYYYGSLYILGSATREGKVAPGLWGNWNTTDTPVWDGDYHLNYNFEMPYNGVYSSNRSELALPYYQAISDYIPQGQTNAYNELGLTRGVYYPVGLGPWGTHSQYEFWGQKSNASYAVLPFIKHYYYTQDLDFLEHIAYPFMKEVGDFWEDDLVLRNGKYVVLHSSFSEAASDDTNTIIDLAFIRALFKGLLTASVDLNVDSGRRALWQDILNNLSPYPTNVKINTGELGYKGADNLTNNYSGLLENYPIYPSEDVGLGSYAGALQLAYDSVDSMYKASGSWIRRRLTEGFSQMAKVGYNPAALYNSMESVIRAEMGSNLFANESDVGGIETVGGIEAINSMLLQSHNDVLRLFPAWPSHKAATFKRLRTQGAFLVDSSVSLGVVQTLSVTSEKGKTVTVLNPWPGKTLLVYKQGGPQITTTNSGEEYTFTTTSGETYDLSPQGGLPTPSLTSTPTPMPTPTPTPGPDLLASWKMNEGTGLSITDSSSHRHDGTLTGASWTTGKSGQALSFDGSTGKYVNIPSAAVNIGSSFTISAWVKHASDRSAYRMIVTKGPKDTGHFELYEDTGSGTVRLYAAGIGDYGSGFTVDDNTWHHIVVTFDGKNIKFYKDATLGSSAAAVGEVVAETETIRIGTLVDGSNPYKGSIDEVNIYNYPLNITKIAELYKSYGIIGWWNLDENGGTVAADLSNLANDGSVNGASWVSGESGSALSFDGAAGKYVDISSAAVNIGSSFTISTWVKHSQDRSGYRVMFAKGPKDSGHYEAYEDTGTGEVRFYAEGIGDFGSGFTVDDDSWHQIVITYNGSTLSFYKDAVLGNSPSVSGAVVDEAESLRIGGLTDGSFPYKGKIDEIKLYNYPLNSAEILDLFEWYAGTIAWWRLNENGGSVTADKSSYAFNGTVTGATWTDGKSGSALSFDGTTGKYVDIANAAVNIGSSFTISAWVKHTQDRSGYRILLAKGPKDSGHYEIYEDTCSGEVRFYAAGIGDFGGGFTVDDHNWHQILITYNGSTLKFYKDTALGSLFYTSGSVSNETETLRMGSLVDGSYPYKGIIDEVKLYNYPIQEQQIIELYNNY